MLQRSERLGDVFRHREIRIWTEGIGAFARIEQLIRSAKHTIVIQMFIWKDDATGRRMAELLLEAADRGVIVDITKDAKGDVFELDCDFVSTRDGSEAVWKRFWSHPHITVTYANENDHAKVYIFDGEILLLSGMNIADEYRYEWRDFLVELRGTHFVERYLSEGEIPSASGNVQLVLNTSLRKEIRPCVMNLLEGAEHSILLEQAYFSDPDVVALLARKSHQGVRITLVLPAKSGVHHHANLFAVRELLTEGDRRRIRVFLSPTFLHGKLILIDRKTTFVGSANLFAPSLDTMSEANVLIWGSNRRTRHRVRAAIRHDIHRSRLLERPPTLGWFGRWLAWMRL